MFLIIITVMFLIWLLKRHDTPCNKTTEIKQGQEKVEKMIPCTDCLVYNHRDIRSKCDSICKSNKNAIYTGEWDQQQKACECEFNAQYKQQFFDSSSIISSKAQAEKVCYDVCKKQDSEWTGKSTDCQCECKLTSI